MTFTVECDLKSKKINKQKEIQMNKKIQTIISIKNIKQQFTTHFQPQS